MLRYESDGIFTARIPAERTRKPLAVSHPPVAAPAIPCRGSPVNIDAAKPKFQVEPTKSLSERFAEAQACQGVTVSTLPAPKRCE